MRITLDIPDDIQNQLQAEFGEDLVRPMLEAIASEGYRVGRLSLGQVAELLDLSVYDADGFLKQHGINPTYTLDDFDREHAALKRSLGG